MKALEQSNYNWRNYYNDFSSLCCFCGIIAIKQTACNYSVKKIELWKKKEKTSLASDETKKQYNLGIKNN